MARSEPPDPSGMGESARIAEMMGALSLAADLGAGQAPETALGATVVAVRMGRVLGMSDDQLADTYYACVTRFLGCSSTATEGAALAMGHDDKLNYALSMCDWSDPDAVESSLEQHLPHDRPPAERSASIRAIRELVPRIPEIAAAHCEQAKILAARLPLPAGVVGLLTHIYSRWDGKYPGARGEEIPLPARVIAVAVAAELFRRAGGIPSVVEMVRQRADGQFDPALCELMARDAAVLFDGFGHGTHWDMFLQSEPGGPRMLGKAQFASVARTFADYADHKCAWLLGHSRQVASLSLRAAEVLHIPEAERNTLYIAALMHDVGRAAVPNGIWDKPDTLTPMELRQAQSHSYQTEMVLSQSAALRSVLEIASVAHERCDGSGYHRRGRLDDPRGGILAAADMYDALTHDRPWRQAYTAEVAAQMLLDAVTVGQLPREAVRAVLEAAGHGKRTSTKAYPAGLSQREAEVLKLIARGLSTKAMAAQLGISPKTADHHVQAVYEKTGARGRAAAALYALAHGITAE